MSTAINTVPTRMIRLPDVKRKLNVGTTLIYKMIKAGTLPRPVKIGTASLWPEHEIDACIMRLMSERPTNPPTAASS